MTFSLEITREAQKSLNKLDNRIIKRIYVHLEEIQRDPFRPRPFADIVKIKGRMTPPAYRLRVGSLRVEYVVYDEEGLILVLRVFKRRSGSDYR
jgi:mRNA-degrading endonuclease RelE of RelBE toxin-antitoxin system